MKHAHLFRISPQIQLEIIKRHILSLFTLKINERFSANALMHHINWLLPTASLRQYACNSTI